jgi:hypothetical protein
MFHARSPVIVQEKARTSTGGTQWRSANQGLTGSFLGQLLSQWGTNGSADINGDGDVDGADLGTMLGAWGLCSS